MTLNKVNSMPLAPLKTIRPSQFSKMKECRLREIWAADKTLLPLLPNSLEARVGTVTHRLYQIAHGGQVLPGCTDPQKAWDILIRQEEETMKQSSLDAALVPIADHLWNYGTKRALALRGIGSIMPSGSGAASAGSSRKIGPEILVSDAPRNEDASVKGFIDLVEHKDSGYVLTDFKTGKILNEEGEVREDYQQQLRLYASLFDAQFNEWPVKLYIVSLDEKVYEVPFSKAQCRELLAEAQKTLIKINEEITSGKPAADFAVPASDHCRFCSYRPACPSYWAAREDSPAWPCDLLGNLVDEPFLQGNGNSRLRLEIAGQERTICDLPGLPAANSLRSGGTVAAYNVLPEYDREADAPSASHFYAGPRTAVYSENAGA